MRFVPDRQIYARENHRRPALHAASNLLQEDLERGIAAFEPLAAEGSVSACLHLASALERRSPPNNAEERRLYRIVVEGGSETALFKLAVNCARYGFIDEAMDLLNAGAADGIGRCMLQAGAIILSDPQSDRQSLNQAERHLRKAVDLGYARAAILLGRAYFSGRYGIRRVPVGVIVYFLAFFIAFKLAIKDQRDPRLRKEFGTTRREDL